MNNEVQDENVNDSTVSTIQEQPHHFAGLMDNTHLTKFFDGATTIFFNLIIAFVIFFIGKWIATYIAHLVKKAVMKSMQDKDLALFIHSVVKYVLIIIVLCAALGKLGLQTSSLVAMLGAAGLAVGLALQGSLSNFAAGTLIMIFRPFHIGDFIEGAGSSGTVMEIGILATILNTPDNKKIIIPNSSLMSNSIINYTANDERRVDFTFGIDYKSDIDLARSVILKIFDENQQIIKNEDKAPVVWVQQMADNSVNLVSRVWVKKEVYWEVFFKTQEAVKKAFDKNGIGIPFPQRDIHVYYENKDEK